MVKIDLYQICIFMVHIKDFILDYGPIYSFSCSVGIVVCLVAFQPVRETLSHKS